MESPGRSIPSVHTPIPFGSTLVATCVLSPVMTFSVMPRFLKSTRASTTPALGGSKKTRSARNVIPASCSLSIRDTSPKRLYASARVRKPSLPRAGIVALFARRFPLSCQQRPPRQFDRGTNVQHLTDRTLGNHDGAAPSFATRILNRLRMKS